MINAWSLLYDELYGEDEMSDNTITSLESDEYDPKPQSDSDDADWNEPVITVGSGTLSGTLKIVFPVPVLISILSSLNSVFSIGYVLSIVPLSSS